VPLPLFPSWRGCITNTFGYDFRKGHDYHQASSLRARRATSHRQKAEFGNGGRTHWHDHQTPEEGRTGEKIAGLGILQVRSRAARMGRNPATGEAIHIKASKKVAFRASKDLKAAI
jgi:Bacterial DNA-binding protein